MYKAQLRVQSFAETVSLSSSVMPGEHGRPLIVGSVLRDDKEVENPKFNHNHLFAFVLQVQVQKKE